MYKISTSTKLWSPFLLVMPHYLCIYRVLHNTDFYHCFVCICLLTHGGKKNAELQNQTTTKTKLSSNCARSLSLSLFAMWGHRENAAFCKAGKELWPEPSHACTLASDCTFQNSCCLTHTVHGMWVGQPELAKTGPTVVRWASLLHSDPRRHRAEQGSKPSHSPS